MRQLLLLLLPTFTLAFIQIDLTGTVHSNVVSSKVNARGFEERVILEQDRASMGIQDEHLKQAIEKINGKKPDEVYITNQTPFGDLNKRFGWKQVHLKIQPLNKDFFYDFRTDTAKLSKTKYENKNSRPRDILINESGNLTNIVDSYWTKPMNITGGTVTIMFNFYTDDNSAHFSKSFGFGARTKYIQNRYYKTNATLRLEPGQKVTAELEALRKIMSVEIPYDVSVSGDVMAKYNEIYHDRYFFKFNINDLQKANNLTMSHRFYQNLIYQVDSDAHIHIRDSNDLILQSIPVESGVSMKGKKEATNKHHVEAQGISMTRKKWIFVVPANLAVEVFTDDDEESEESKEKAETEAKVEKKEN